MVQGPNGHTLRPAALLDTGADCACFPDEFIEEFGINRAQCHETPGTAATGEMELLRWDEGSLLCTVEGQELKLDAIFRDGLKHPVLGREDFFMRFIVTFRERESRFDVELYPESGD